MRLTRTVHSAVQTFRHVEVDVSGIKALAAVPSFVVELVDGEGNATQVTFTPASPEEKDAVGRLFAVGARINVDFSEGDAS